VLIGGEGADSIEGENADDILVAGYTSHDNDVAALTSIRNQWNASTDYATRVANLRAGLLSTTDVFDDSDTDTLIGGNGQDWFLAQKDGTLDWIVDQKKSETSTDVA
jgi:Ca2+-binding RTX toxin-like protein